MKPNLYISTGGLILNLITADGRSFLSTERLFELGRFIKKRLQEQKVYKTYGNVYLDLRDATIQAALKYLSDYFEYNDETIYQRQETPEKLTRIYELDPVVDGIFHEFLERDDAHTSTMLRAATC
ncbi:MAG: hypothetical protein LBL84_02285 [Candidatus Nomurabacteria bacterium]|jgi:hypothetical protein|nr:hypothetical protein [Candidatus Nomurabacteria bacterium]